VAFERIFDHFPVEATLRPAAAFPNLEERCNYCMALRRSTRVKTPVAAPVARPPSPPSAPPRTSAVPVVAVPVQPPPVLTTSLPLQQDRHVRAWKALQTVRARPKPPVGRPPPNPGPLPAPRRPSRPPSSRCT
jgi:hypothetical protein